MKFKKIKLGRYFFDFVSVFFAVIAAFALNNWNDNRRDAEAEEKILLEIRNGLVADLEDIKDNKKAHRYGIRSCDFLRRIIEGKTVDQDSVQISYLYLTVSNASVMNTSGYESLKSKGLEIIENDSIRIKIIQLYDISYQSLTKLEEENPMTQIFNNFYLPINQALSPYMKYNRDSNIMTLSGIVELEPKEKKLLESYLWRMQWDREILLGFYERTEEKINELLGSIEKELDY